MILNMFLIITVIISPHFVAGFIGSSALYPMVGGGGGRAVGGGGGRTVGGERERELCGWVCLRVWVCFCVRL